MWSKIIGIAAKVVNFLFSGIAWVSAAYKVIEYYIILVELADIECEVEGKKKKKEVLDKAWDDLTKISWWPSGLSRETFDVVAGWIINRVIRVLNSELDHAWRKNVDLDYVEKLEHEVDEIFEQ